MLIFGMMHSCGRRIRHRKTRSDKSSKCQGLREVKSETHSTTLENTTHVIMRSQADQIELAFPHADRLKNGSALVLYLKNSISHTTFSLTVPSTYHRPALKPWKFSLQSSHYV
jgi:hypothetical protein